MPLETWIQHSRVDMFLYDWQTVIAGALAVAAALITVLVTWWIERRKAGREIDALRKSLAIEIRLQTVRAFGAYNSLERLSRSEGPFTARVVESLTQMPDPIIYSSNATKVGLLGPDAMDVLIFYVLLEAARNGVARVMTSRTPDDLAPPILLATAI